MAISKKHRKIIQLADYKKKAVPYPVDTTSEFPQPGQPGYLGTYTPPAPYGPQEEREKMASDKTHTSPRMPETQKPTLEASKEMVRKVYVRQMREIIEEMRNTQTPTLDGLKEIVRKRAYARRMRDLRIERIDEIQRLEREGRKKTMDGGEEGGPP